MKSFKNSIILFVLTLLLANSCKKDNSAPSGGISLTVVNAVVGSAALVTNFSNEYNLSNYYQNAAQIYYGDFYEVGGYSENTPLSLYQYPDTTPQSKPLFELNLNLRGNTIHTLFLTGTVLSPDTLFTTDNPPYHPPTDSSVGVRFVNLSPGSAPVNINLSGTTISYKGITAFNNYPADASVSSYEFQFSDAATGTVLSTYTLDAKYNRFRNVTIALIGRPDGTGSDAQATFLIKNY